MARTLHEIAVEIMADWPRAKRGAARPYLEAMGHLQSVEEKYGLDSGKSIVLYFLSNAGTWRGETARRIKKELKELVGEK